MSKYVHSILKGRREDSLQPTEHEATTVLNTALARHEARGERARGFTYGVRVAFEIWDAEGQIIGKYWLSDDKNSREPTERDGPRAKF